MKKKLLSLFVLTVPFLFGCNSSSEYAQLTYGTFASETCIKIHSGDFDTSINNHENFLMAIWPDESICSCWTNFERVINDVVKNDHLLVYAYPCSEVAGNTTMKNMGGFYEIKNAPTFYIVNEGKVMESFRYNSENPIFTSRTGFMETIQKYCRLPKIMFINREQMDEKIQNNVTVIVGRTGCPDCNYVVPNILVPYFKNKDVNNYLYYFDIEPYLGTSDYQNIKNQYNLSITNNPILGFGEGVVPSFQRYESGQLKDMAIYSNDGLLTSNGDGTYRAPNSYYNETRLPCFHYLNNVTTKVLTNIVIPSNEVGFYDEAKEMPYWLDSGKAHYYQDILNGFLDTYL